MLDFLWEMFGNIVYIAALLFIVCFGVTGILVTINLCYAIGGWWSIILLPIGLGITFGILKTIIERF